MTISLLLVMLGVFTTWLILTPPGFNEKLSAAGYAVCHQIESHSLVLGGSVLPLCARCTGMYMGTLVGLMFLYPKDQRSGSPSKPKIALLAVFMLAFILDGINSSLTLLQGMTSVYPPSNLLRLITGMLMGVTLANLILPLWNQTLWSAQDKSAILKSWKQFWGLMGIEVIVGMIIFARISFLYYPIGILTIGTIFVMLGMIYTLLWVIILKKENTFIRFKDGVPYCIAGLTTAIIQIGLMDLVRFSITGTWSGFQL